MKIHEYQARGLLQAYQIPVSKAELVHTPQEAFSAFKRLANPACIAKVQVLMGGRGKAGGVQRLQTAGEAEKFATSLLNTVFST